MGSFVVYWLYRPFIGTYSVSLSTKWIFIAFTLIWQNKVKTVWPEGSDKIEMLPVSVRSQVLLLYIVEVCKVQYECSVLMDDVWNMISNWLKLKCIENFGLWNKNLMFILEFKSEVTDRWKQLIRITSLMLNKISTKTKQLSAYDSQDLTRLDLDF